MNHIMVFFSDYYNSELFLKLRDILAYFLLICKNLLFQLKNVKNNHSITSDSLEYTKSCTKKRHARPFVKTAPYMRMDLNRDEEI